jgi:hypothetical protein
VSGRDPVSEGPTPRLDLAGRGVRAFALAVLLLFGGMLGGAALSCFGALLAAPDKGAGSNTALRRSPDVVLSIRELARLETVTYHVERVIDVRERQSRFFGLVEAEDAILLVAAGDVLAGVDLGRLSAADVVVDPVRGRAEITLPPPQIFLTRLDADRTYVHTRQTDLWARRQEQLETRARQEAERTLERAALEAGVLDRARRGAERTVASLVRSLGYSEVVVRTRRE